MPMTPYCDFPALSVDGVDEAASRPASCWPAEFIGLDAPAGFAEDLKGCHSPEAEPAYICDEYIPSAGHFFCAEFAALPGPSSLVSSSTTDGRHFLVDEAYASDACGDLHRALGIFKLEKRSEPGCVPHQEHESNARFGEHELPVKFEPRTEGADDVRQRCTLSRSHGALPHVQGSRTLPLTIEELEDIPEDQDCAYVDMPVEIAAPLLGLSKTTFNKQVRALHIMRWPYRKRASLCSLRAVVETALVKTHALTDVEALELVQGRIMAEHADHTLGTLSAELLGFRQKIFKWVNANAKLGGAASGKRSPRKQKRKAAPHLEEVVVDRHGTACCHCRICGR